MRHAGRCCHAGVRLLVLWSCVLAACDEGSAPAPPPPSSRVEAVAAKASAGDPLKEFCDVRADPGSGQAVSLPRGRVRCTERACPGRVFVAEPVGDLVQAVRRGNAAPRAAGRSNSRPRARQVDLRFVSVDEDAQAIGNFRSAAPGHARIDAHRRPVPLAPLVAELGLDSGAGLPIHVFVEKGARVRCVRAGAVLDSHFDTIASMVQ